MDKKIFILISLFTGIVGGIYVSLGIFMLKGNSFAFDSTTFSKLKGARAYVVQSGSMEPSIKTGSVVFTIPGDYVIGDTITFYPTAESKKIVTHRIVSTEEGITTKGDANEETDIWTLEKDQIIGKVSLTIPYVGYAVDVAKKPQGFIFFVVVPVTIIIYEELKVLLSEIAKGLRKIKRRIKKESSRGINLIPQRKRAMGVPKAAIIIPVVGTFFVVMAVSGSYLSDIEKSMENVFRAAESYAEENILRETLVLSNSAIDEEQPTPSPTPATDSTPEPSPQPTVNDVNEIVSPTPTSEFIP